MNFIMPELPCRQTMKALKIHNLDEGLVTNNSFEVFHHVHSNRRAGTLSPQCWAEQPAEQLSHVIAINKLIANL